MRINVRPAAALMLVVVAMAVSACGGSSSVTSSNTSSSSSATSPGVSRAEAAIKSGEAQPTFAAPGAGLNGRAIAKGKTVVLIPYDTRLPYDVALMKAFATYATKAGFSNVTDYSTAGLPDQWARGVDYAISRHANAIVLVDAADPRTFLPAMKRAKAAGITVLTQNLGDASDPLTGAFGAGGIPLGYDQAGKDLANYAIWKTNGKADVLAVDGDPGGPFDTDLKKAMLATFKQNCPSCTVHTVAVNGADWATQMTPSVEGALKADSNINFILPYYDSQTTYVTPAETAVGTKIPIASFNGTPAFMEMVRKGQLAMDVSEDIAWVAAGSVDALLRTMGHVQPDHGMIDEHTPLRIFDGSNISQLGSGPITYNSGYGSAANGYLKVWGIS
jgi:ribose transport system substrate-binding protein